MNMNRTIAGALGLALAATAGLTVAGPAGSAGTTDSDHGDFDDAPSDAAKHSTKLTAEELDMLLGWNDDETSSDAARGGGDR